MQDMLVSIPGLEDPLEEEMAAHSSILAWEISWTEEPGGLQSMGWQRVGHDLVTNAWTWTAYYPLLSCVLIQSQRPINIKF